MEGKPLNVLVFGAHPDDCDLRAGGMALKYRALGHRVRFVSVTNGDTGHHQMGGGPLARRRYAEAQASAAIADIEYEVLDIHNGELEATVPNRKTIIRLMREFEADLVLCHRPNDYHPDHRAVGMLVQDAAFVVTVPNMAPLTPALRRPPVVGYLYDTFTVPNPYVPTVAIDTDDVLDRKIAMCACHKSQMFEWLPYSGGYEDEVPQGDAQRHAWLAKRLTARFRSMADNSREALVKWYGEEKGKAIRTCETVQISQYGRPLADDDIPKMFPFFPR